MRFSFLIAGSVVCAAIGLCAPASANAFDLLFGTRQPSQGAWCARTNTGAGRVDENCIFELLRGLPSDGDQRQSWLLHPESGIHRLPSTSDPQKEASSPPVSLGLRDECPLSGVKRPLRGRWGMSANDDVDVAHSAASRVL